MDLVTIEDEAKNAAITAAADGAITERCNDERTNPNRQAVALHIGLQADVSWISGIESNYTNIVSDDDGLAATYRLTVTCFDSPDCFVG